MFAHLFNKKKNLLYTDSTGETHKVRLQKGETVLEGLLRSGHEIPNSCRAGACQACAMNVTQGVPCEKSQRGLKEIQKKNGTFLACQCIPSVPLAIRANEQSLKKYDARVLEKDILNSSIIRLRLSVPFLFEGGQFCTLWKDASVQRSYSIASIPSDGYLEFHIKRLDNGNFSDWAYTTLNVGDTLTIQGPYGECFYDASNKRKPIFLSGIGTGLAPLLGIIRSAKEAEHQGNVQLFLAAKSSSNFYCIDELNSLKSTLPNFSFTLLHQNNDSEEHTSIQQNIYEYVKTQYPDFAESTVYLCGAASFVQKMKKTCYLSGTGMGSIYADPFSAAK